jgi:hypothetical protein
MAWATPEDVVDDWIGGGAPDDLPQVAKWIGKVERLIRYHVPTIDDRIAAGNEPHLLDDARDVVIGVVHRVYRNPEGIRQRNETTGPFTGSVTYAGDVPGGLALTADEIDRLSGAGHAPQRAFGVSMIPKTSPFYPGGAQW